MGSSDSRLSFSLRRSRSDNQPKSDDRIAVGSCSHRSASPFTELVTKLLTVTGDSDTQDSEIPPILGFRSKSHDSGAYKPDPLGMPSNARGSKPRPPKVVHNNDALCVYDTRNNVCELHKNEFNCLCGSLIVVSTVKHADMQKQKMLSKHRRYLEEVAKRLAKYLDDRFSAKEEARRQMAREETNQRRQGNKERRTKSRKHPKGAKEEPTSSSRTQTKSKHAADSP